MPLDRLYINIINNATDKELILTSKILIFNTKEKIELYPYIHSSSTYNYSTINSLSYDDKIVFFFNKNKFEELLTDPTNNTFDKSILNKNFEFTIKSLFSPNMGFASYRQSMSYYDRRFVPSASTFGINFMSQNKYSYININNATYTITSNIWLNDALNIPPYKDIIQTYYKAQDEIKSVDELQLQNEKKIETLLNLISLDIAFNIEDLTKKRDTNKYIIEKNDGDINKNLEAIINDFRNNSYTNLLFLRRYTLQPDNTLTFNNIKSYTLKNEIEKLLNENSGISNFLKHPRKKRFHMFIEYIVKNQSILTKNSDFKELQKFVKHFINEVSKGNGLKDQLLDFLKVHKTKSFYNIDIKPFLQFKEEFTELENELDKIIVFNFIKSGGKEKSNNFNNEYLKKQFPNFNNFIDSLVKIGEKKKLSNDEWQKTIDIYNNRYLSYEKNEENFFDYIIKCLNNNDTCKNSLKPSKYMHFTLDVLNNIQYKNLYTNNIGSVYEGYIRLKFIKGRLDQKTFTKNIKCDYYNNNREILNEPTKNNELLENSYLEDLEEKIKKQSSSKKQPTSNKNKNTKKGGRKKNKSKTKKRVRS